MSGITGNEAKDVNKGKRKAKCRPDTIVGAYGSQVTTYKRIAPSTSRFTGAGKPYEWDGEPEIQESPPPQPGSTVPGATPDPSIGVSVRPGQVPPSGTLSCSIPRRRTEETRFTNYSARGEEGMLHLDHLAPGALEFQAPIGFPSQPLDFGSADASGHFPSVLSPSAIHPGRQLPGQGCTQDATPPLIICPWRSLAEGIMSIDLAISNISRIASPTTAEPLLKEMEVLLDRLKRTYFNLQESVEHPMRFSRGTPQGVQSGHSDSRY